MHCFITGVAGFVGSSLCDRLLADGHSVIGLDSFEDYYPRQIKERNLQHACGNSRFTLVEDNLLCVDLGPLLDGVDWVFHQAAQAGVRASWGESFKVYCDNNVLATQRLLEAAKGKPGLKKIVCASSSSVYGDAETFPTTESVRPHPLSPYGVTKLAAEHLAVLYAHNFDVPTVSLRYFTVYGPRQRPDMAFNRFIRAALSRKPLTLYGDGEQCRDFTFIDDVVAANLLAAQHGSPGDVFNIGGGDQATINQVVSMISQCTGPIQVNRLEKQAGDALRTSADTQHARNRLGFRPRTSLAEGIKREVQWLRSESAPDALKK